MENPLIHLNKYYIILSNLNEAPRSKLHSIQAKANKACTRRRTGQAGLEKKFA
jgi:hypothetical protein